MLEYFRFTEEETNITKNFPSDHIPAIQFQLPEICKLIIGFIVPLGNQL